MFDEIQERIEKVKEKALRILAVRALPNGSSEEEINLKIKELKIEVEQYFKDNPMSPEECVEYFQSLEKRQAEEK